MKNIIRILSLILTLSLLLSLVPASVLASDGIIAKGRCDYELSWELTASGTLTISGIGEMNDFPWRKYSNQIVSVIILPGVTSIKYAAFKDCRNLRNVTIPYGVERIGDDAFQDCRSLTSVTLPDSITYIGGWAFGSCASLTSIRLPNNLTGLGHDAFLGCSSLAELTIPESTEYIGEWAFAGCPSLTSIVIPDSVQSIGRSAFAGCSNLTDISISNGLTEISTNLFVGCSSLQSVTIPGNVISIGERAFEDCSSLTDVVISEGVSYIDKRAFYRCKNLTTVSIPKSVTDLCYDVFEECSKLHSLIFNNPTCDIWNSYSTCGSWYTTTIYGYSDSTAQSYAYDNGYTFVSLDDLDLSLGPIIPSTPTVSEEITHLILADLAYEHIIPKSEGYTIGDWIAENWDTYSGSKNEIIEANTTITKAQVFSSLGDWKIVETRKGAMGFSATVFEKDNHYIIAYTGSELSDMLVDWAVDLKFALFNFLEPAQFSGALAIYRQYQTRGDVTVTGHSLGGALASYVSIITDAKGYSFDGACGYVVDLAYFYNPLEINFTSAQDMNFTNYTDPRSTSFLADMIQHTKEDLLPGICNQTNQNVKKVYIAPAFTHQIYSTTELAPGGKTLQLTPVVEHHTVRNNWHSTIDLSMNIAGWGSSLNNLIPRMCLEGNVLLGTAAANDIAFGDSIEHIKNIGNYIATNVMYGGNGKDTLHGSVWTDILVPGQLAGDILSGGLGGDIYILDCSFPGSVTIEDNNGDDKIIVKNIANSTAQFIEYLGSTGKNHHFLINEAVDLFIPKTSLFTHTFTLMNEAKKVICKIDTKGGISFTTKVAPRKGNKEFKETEPDVTEITLIGEGTVEIYNKSNILQAEYSTSNYGVFSEEYGVFNVMEMDGQDVFIADLITGYSVRMKGYGNADVIIAGTGGEDYVTEVTKAVALNLANGETVISTNDRSVLQNGNAVEIEKSFKSNQVSIDRENCTLEGSDTQVLIGTTSFPDGHIGTDIAWLSSDPNVVRCDYDESGICTLVPMSEGTATVYAIAPDSGISASCDITVFTDHNWGSGVVTIEPTEISDGSITYSCTRCSETRTESIPKLEVQVFEITKQPEIYVGPIGSTASFHVEASGEGLTYQWYYSPDNVGWSASGLTGNKTDSLQVAFTANRAGQFYRCEIRNDKGEVLTSDAVFMCEKLPPITIQQQPESFMGKSGETGVFQVKASGEGLTYQWYYSKDNGVTWSKSGQTGSTTDTMNIQLTMARAGQCYRCEITDADGNILNSDQAAIKLETENIEIKYQPVSANGYIGETTSFHVEATGMGLTYQWYYSKNGGQTWSPSGMAGCDTDTLKVQLTAARVGQSYRCAVTDNKGNTVYSDVVAMNQRISVVGVLEINAQPKDFTGKVGDTAVFYVDAVGEALTFQWEFSKDGKVWYASELPGNRTDTLRVDVTAARFGQSYRCVITDAKGKQIISDPVTLKQA